MDSFIGGLRAPPKPPNARSAPAQPWHSSISHHGPVAVDADGRRTATPLVGQASASGPRSSLENARQRKIPYAEPLAHQRREAIEQRHGERPPLHDHLVAGTMGLAEDRGMARLKHSGVEKQSAVAIFRQRG